MDQNQTTDIGYSKRWQASTLDIDFYEYENLYIAQPTSNNQILQYKDFEGPDISYSLQTRKLFGSGDKWHNNLYITYRLDYLHDQKHYTKESCIDNDENNICDICEVEEACNYQELGVCIFQDDCEEDIVEDNEETIDNILIWNPNETIDITTRGAKNTVNIQSSNALGPISLTPYINLYEGWAFDYREYTQIENSELRLYEYLYIEKEGFNRRLTWNSGMTMSSTLYGIIPFNIGNILSLYHKITSKITYSYSPDLLSSNNYEDQFISFEEENETITYDILSSSSSHVGSLNNGSEKIIFELDNIFQAKINDFTDTEQKIDILSMSLSFDYKKNNDDKKFSLINSYWSFKKKNGGELFSLFMQHDIYEKNSNQELYKKGKLPRLLYMSAQLSTMFSFSGYSIGSEDNEHSTFTQSDTLNTLNYNSLLYQDELKPKIGDSELWRTDIGMELQGEYQDDDKKWEFDHFNLGSRTTMHLTENWLLTYSANINLLDMNIHSQNLKFYRELHCWEFMFTWWPDQK